jgi:TetR/AcrR family transcriptional regulator
MRSAARASVETAECEMKAKLRSAAAEVFARKGYAGASVREIVERTGVTKPVLYYHFGSKEGIYQAILESALRDFDERVGAVGRLTGSASLRLRRLCEEVFRIFERHSDAVRVMHAIYYGPPQGAPFFDFDKALLRLHDGVFRLVREGRRAGEFRGDVQAMALAVLGALNECTDLELTHPEMAVGRVGFGKVLDVVFRGMEGKDAR